LVRIQKIIRQRGYDDSMKIKNTHGQKETTSALLIRNSWGKGWKEESYGWFPCE
jgi:C1A family cysteine protease